MVVDVTKNYSLVNENDVIINSEPIHYKDKDFGRIIIAYSLDTINASINRGLITSLITVGAIFIVAMAKIHFLTSHIDLFPVVHIATL